MSALSRDGEPWAQLLRSEHVRRIVRFLRRAWALSHALSLMSWDLETYMPREGVYSRSLATEELSAELHSIMRSDELARMVEEASRHLDEMNEYERGVVRVVSRDVRIARSLPEELVRREARVTSEATVVWKTARQKGDFNMFKPYLEEIVRLAREKAERLGYEETPYDALLDLYEEGLRARTVEQVFNVLVPATRRILAEIAREGFYPQRHPLEGVGYEKEQGRRLVRAILDYLHWPWDRGRFDESAHPFTIDLGVTDVRITVRYELIDIKRLVYSTIHEYGHALYELQQDPRLETTPIIGGVSLGVHESQSRFWENVFGRSPWFMPVLRDLIDKATGITRGLDPLELYRYVNTVRPGLIRVDADEVTYNLHIYLRYRLERSLVEEKLRVDELPEAWDTMMEELLGVRPRNPSEGVLQDIHWSHGSIGYFPTYTIGNVVAAMIWRAMGGPEAEPLRKTDVRGIQEWLRTRIHVWGRVYPPAELVERATGSKLDPNALVEYLDWKYTRLPEKPPEELTGTRL